MKITTKTIAKFTGAMVLGSALSLVAPPTASAYSAAPPADTYRGNACHNGSRDSVSYRGVQACFWVNGGTPGKSASLSVGAVDVAKDGLSAKADGSIHQYAGGKWVMTHTLPSVVNSSGSGTTKVSPAKSISRKTGASHVRVTLRACGYDSPSGVNEYCETVVTQMKW